MSDTALRVVWVTPLNVPNIDNTTAKATASGRTETCSPKTISPGELSCDIDNLNKLTSYSVRVQACKDGQCGYSDTVTATTLPGNWFNHFFARRCIRHDCTTDFGMPTLFNGACRQVSTSRLGLHDVVSFLRQKPETYPSVARPSPPAMVPT